MNVFKYEGNIFAHHFVDISILEPEKDMAGHRCLNVGKVWALKEETIKHLGVI